MTVLQNQVPRIGTSEVVTLTVGGNEVDFFPLLNECVYQWRPVSTCHMEMAKARDKVQSSTFISNFNALVTEIMRRIRPEAVLYVTGYAQFFNDKTDQCDNVTFSRLDPTNFLTKDLRKQLNEMILMINEVIKAVTQVHGAVYVDIDRVFRGHRFCEDGVLEPAPERSDTWFFTVGTQNLSLVDQSGFDRSEPPIQNNARYSLTEIPDMKTFHPTGLGHTGIAQEIVREVLSRLGRSY